MKLSKKQFIAVIKLKRIKKIIPAAGVMKAHWTFNPEGKS